VDSNGYNYTSTLVNNRFEGNFSTDQGGGAYLISLTTTLTNNSFANNEALHGAGLALELNSETADTDLANNLFWNNAALLSADDLWIDNDPDNDGTASPLELMHNDFDQTQPASLVVTLPISIDPSNLDAVDPLFADDLLHLSDGSPAIDAGNDAASELPATDMDGEARILGAAVDIGADEYSGSVLPLTLSVVTDGTGLGLVTSSPAGIDCGSDCSEPFAPGTVVDLTPNPNAGSILAGWTGCDSTGGDVCRVTMNGDRGVTATFNVFQATLSVNKIGTGGGVIASTPAGIDCGNDCNEVYPIGTAVELTATAGANATFVGWSGACSGSGSCMITMNGDLDVTASFDQIRHDLTINPLGAGTGSVISIPAGIDCGNDCTADFVQGQAVDLTASAAAGSEFVGWSGCDTTNGSLCSLVIGNDRVVSATFDLLVGACASMTIHQTDTTDCPDLRSILSIQDDQGQPVTGLIETDFSLDEDGIARAVQLEAGGERAVGLVIDTSGSLEDTDLANIRQACIDFIGLLSPGDRVAVYQFDYTANLLQDYTSDLSLAIDAINTLVSPGGNTALYDALFMAADDADTIGGSKGVVVLTDGQDNVSNRTVTEAVERAVDAGVPVFTIGFGSADAGVLTDIADRTGGLYYAGVDSDDLQDLLDRLGTVLNSQYVLLWQSGFPDGGRHGIAIEAQVSPSCRISATASYDQAGSPCQTSTCMAERSLPLGYAAELPIPVAVAVRPEDSVQTYALEDIPPAGMAVSNISDAGVLDNGKVKWGPFFDNLDRDLGYNITPPSGTQGSLGWSGLFSHDGVSEPICGDALLPEGLVHPADYGAAGDDWRIEINELTSYTSAWKTGTSWPRPPTSIPLPYAVNAGYLWQNGEDYHFDPLSDPPWEIGLIASPIPRAQRLATAEVLTDHALSYLNPEQYSPGSPVQVTLEITPPTGTQAYAVEETPPEGWAVSDISDSGTFAPQSNQIRWGLFFDDGFRSLTYRITPPAQASDTQTLHGQAAFDQTTVPIGGQRNLPPAGSLCGDANRSGATDIIDALWISRYSAGLNPQPFDEVAADVQVPPNGVSIVDALLCARFAAGLQTTGTCLGAP
jgi:VWFA-related protein